MGKKKKLFVSIFIIWLFNISGIFGILSSNSDWFLSLTPLNLGLYFLMILWNLEKITVRFFTAASIPFFIGFVTEYLGVNHGFIFGSYEYGENLGWKVGGVPIMICVNWIVLTIVTSDVSLLLSKNLFLRAFLGALFMTLLDMTIEVSAPRFDFWEFENGIVPIQNYIGWFVVSLIAHLIYNSFKIRSQKLMSVHILIAIAIFFLTFLFF